jgi:hypothetical protein
MLYNHSRSRINKRRRRRNYTRRFASIYGGDEYLRILRGKYRLRKRTRRSGGRFKLRFKKTRRRKYKQRH